MTINEYFRNKFKKKVYKICIDAGFTCPNRDGTKGFGGCTYCNNEAFSGTSSKHEFKIRSFTLPHINTNENLPFIEEQIIKGKERLKARYKAEAFILYFQSYTNTYASIDKLKKLYDYVYFDEDIIGLSIGTRPDCINAELLSLLKSYAVDKEVWIEYGLESSHNKTLELINRCHSYEDFLVAVELTASYGIPICVHIIFGLPGESYSDMIETVKRISSLPIWGIKIHPLHIVKGTYLAQVYKNKRDYPPMLLIEEDGMMKYVNLVKEALRILPSSIIIHRLTGEASRDLLIAPLWINEKAKILELIMANR